MVTTTRTQNRYDHRLRELVRATQDVSYAVRHAGPRSTARGCLTASSDEENVKLLPDFTNVFGKKIEQFVIGQFVDCGAVTLSR